MISITRGVGDDHVSISLMDVKSIHRRVQEYSDVGPFLKCQKILDVGKGYLNSIPVYYSLPRLNSSASVTLARKHGMRRTRDDKARQFIHHPAGSGPGMHFKT